jgi:hypothetical protein
MDERSTLCLLSDAEVDAVAGGRHGNGGGGGGGNGNGGSGNTIVEIVEISIGEVVAEAVGGSTATINLVGIGNATTTNVQSGGRHHF